GMQQATLYVNLLVNGRPAGTDIPVRQQGTRFMVRTSDLLNAGVQHEPLAALNAEEWLDVSGQPDIRTEYDGNALRLNVIVPISWLPEQNFSSARRRTNGPAHSDIGALISYDFYGADLPGDARIASVWSEQ